MYPKIMILSLSLLLLAGGLLHLSQSRINEERRQAQLREKMIDTQHEIWRSDVKIAEKLKPGTLREKVEGAALTLENPLQTSEEVRQRRAPQVRTVQHIRRDR